MAESKTAKKKVTYYLGTGRRKTSVARVRLAEGSGKIVINDPYTPGASASNLWVGVEQQPNPSSTITYDFEKWYKPYQFWVKTDANGNFTIPDVIAGANYTLYAFGPGAAGNTGLDYFALLCALRAVGFSVP